MRSTHSLTVISLGGGVQSSVMSFMASGGAFGAIPDCAIFADTHWEPSTIYTHLDWLSRNLSFPLYVVDNGRSLREDAKALTNHSGNRGLIDLPLYLKGPARAGERNGQGDGMGRRQCAECRCSTIMSVANWSAKMSSHGRSDIDAEGADETSGAQQRSGRSGAGMSGGRGPGSERTPHEAYSGGL